MYVGDIDIYKLGQFLQTCTVSPKLNSFKFKINPIPRTENWQHLKGQVYKKNSDLKIVKPVRKRMSRQQHLTSQDLCFKKSSKTRYTVNVKNCFLKLGSFIKCTQNK